LEKIVEISLHGTNNRTSIIKIVFEEANNGDIVSRSILKETAYNMALAVAGCINHLNFNDKVYCIMAGSVWSKASNTIQQDYFKEKVLEKTNKDVEFIVLDETPAFGAIVWAMELYLKKHPDIEIINKIKQQVLIAQKELPST